MPDHTARQPTRQDSSQWPLLEPQMSHSKYWQAESHFLFNCLEMMHEFDRSNLYLMEQSVRLTLRRNANWQGRYGSNPTIHILNFRSRCRWVTTFVLRTGFHCNEAEFDLQPIPNVVPERKIPFPDGNQLRLVCTARGLSLQSCWWAAAAASSFSSSPPPPFFTSPSPPPSSPPSPPPSSSPPPPYPSSSSSSSSYKALQPI